MDKNAKEWKGERAALLKRIKVLEAELARLQAQRAQHDASRASTEAPAELSQTLEAVSQEQEQEFSEDVDKVKFLRSGFPNGIGKRAGVFDQLYQEAVERRGRQS